MPLLPELRHTRLIPWIYAVSRAPAQVGKDTSS
jgi:hypothetical protein